MEAGAHYPAKLELIIMFHGALQKFRARNERQERDREDESSLESTPRERSLSLSLSLSLLVSRPLRVRSSTGPHRAAVRGNAI